MQIETHLSEEISSFTYVKNSHYIKLTDKDGQSIKLIPTSLRQGKCRNCSAIFYLESNYGHTTCPACGNIDIEWKWGGVQLCFVPEEPSDFKPPSQNK